MLRQGGIKGRFTRPSPPWNLRARGAAHSSARWSRGLTQVSHLPAAPAAGSPKRKKKGRGSEVSPRRSPANYTIRGARHAGAHIAELPALRLAFDDDAPLGAAAHEEEEDSAGPHHLFSVPYNRVRCKEEIF